MAHCRVAEERWVRYFGLGTGCRECIAKGQLERDWRGAEFTGSRGWRGDGTELLVT